MSLSPSPAPPTGPTSKHHQYYHHGAPNTRTSSPPPHQPPTIDRQKTTPFLLNFCYRSSAFHNLTDFPVSTPSDPNPPLPSHLQIYTWYSCTLRELAMLLTSALPRIVPDPAIGTRLSFRLIYPDHSSGPGGRGNHISSGRLDEGRARYVSREMGSVVISATATGEAEGHVNGTGGGEGEGENGTHDGAGASVSAAGGFELGGEDAEKTLADARFVIGDFIDCAVFPPLSDGSVVPRASVGGRGGGGMFRENSYGRGRGSGYGMGRGGYGGSRGDFGANIPSGEWRRGERIPESGGYRGGGGFRGGRGSRRDPY